MWIKYCIEVKVTPPEKTIEDEMEKTIIYKTFSVKNNNMERKQEDTAENV